MSPSQPLRTAALRALIVSVVVSCVLGVSALLGGSSMVMGQVLFTSLCGTAASLLALIGALGLERGGRSGWGLTAIVASVFGFGLTILGIWAHIRSEVLMKLAVTGVIVGSLAAHAVLLGLARMQPEHRWATYVTRVLAGILSALLLLALWGEIGGKDFWRFTGALAVLVAAGSLLVPILARLSRVRHEAAREGLGAQAKYRPACGQGIQERADPLTCGMCGRTFRVTFEGEAASPFL
jgi:hypothetical protein